MVPKILNISLVKYWWSTGEVILQLSTSPQGLDMIGSCNASCFSTRVPEWPSLAAALFFALKACQFLKRVDGEFTIGDSKSIENPRDANVPKCRSEIKRGLETLFRTFLNLPDAFPEPLETAPNRDSKSWLCQSATTYDLHPLFV